jgi:hypothetical protein
MEIQPHTSLQQMDSELHDLCQPLTALQCQLELGKMLDHETALREAVDGALMETRRMFEIVARMRERLLDEENTDQ